MNAENNKTTGATSIRQDAWEKFQKMAPWKRPQNLVEAECSACGITYYATDLSALVKNGSKPVIGPCAICGKYTTKVIPSPK